MKRVIVIVLVGLLAWQGYLKYQASRAENLVRQVSVDVEPSFGPSPRKSETVPSDLFKCDGRTHCSQMTSCAEARFFLQNCPGVKMDGNNDGIPCEQQWCK